MLRRGFAVTPTDGSPEMAREAERRLNRPVEVRRFGDLEGEAQFDGIWACSCLLHCPAVQLSDVLKRIHRLLRPSGILFASFKSGSGQGRDKFGRYYHYLSSARLKEIAEHAAPWKTIEIEEAPRRGYDDRSLTWLNCMATKR